MIRQNLQKCNKKIKTIIIRQKEKKLEENQEDRQTKQDLLSSIALKKWS